MNIDTERLMLALTLLMAGFIIVFFVLVLLIVIITIYGKIIRTVQGASQKHKEQKERVVVSAKTEEKPSEPVFFGDSDDGGEEIPGEIIAAIAAAVDAVYGKSAHGRIRSVKRSRSPRSAWGSAGLIDNTRPF